MIIRILWLAVLMGIVPLVLGFPWVKIFNPKHAFAFSYCSGFFVALVLFQIVCLPFVMSFGKFSTVVTVYSIILVISCCVSIRYTLKNHITKKLVIDKLHWTEWIYLVAFLSLFCIQIVRSFTYDITYMSYDDAVYTVYAADAYAGNGIFNIGTYTGLATTLITKHDLTSWNVYPAYFALVSGVPVAVISHTIQYFQLIVLAYTTYWYVAGETIKSRDNQLIFMVIIALFYWYGYHSHYSLTFRLLGPNYQGKAVLAVSLTPLVLTVLVKIMEEEYTIIRGIYLLVLSIASITFTLWGSGTMLVVSLVPLGLSLIRKERKWKHLLYAVWSSVIPFLTIGYFLLNKYMV